MFCNDDMMWYTKTYGSEVAGIQVHYPGKGDILGEDIHSDSLSSHISGQGLGRVFRDWRTRIHTILHLRNPLYDTLCLLYILPQKGGHNYIYIPSSGPPVSRLFYNLYGRAAKSSDVFATALYYVFCPPLLQATYHNPTTYASASHSPHRPDGICTGTGLAGCPPSDYVFARQSPAPLFDCVFQYTGESAAR